ncbi:cytochrome P450 [Amycolatopsis sp. QT-25]|uniref:cytochrome P450 family protein n=1 Tax=Amycolatopsis sp. QT-25 TaxID=3034022 RepID=UPI0023EDABBA|nr:cytochrome P450 [Amycolatopsis sp. QT-25]WET82320.1 cytochrome P450 [Amycolatopsis sp. QT-25]
MPDAAYDDAAVPVLFGPEFDRDPSPAYEWLRANAPAFRLPLPGDTWTWLLTRHADVVSAMADPRLSKCPSVAADHWRQANLGLPADHRPSLVRHMNNFEGEEHARLRKACAGAFGPRRLQHLRDRTHQLANELLDPILERGEGDLVEDFAYPLGIRSICELIGIPDTLLDEVRPPALVVAAGDVTDMASMLKATDELDALLADVVARKRAEPGADLISDLLTQEAAGKLTEEEVAATAFLSLIAGHETTISLIASTALTLITHPEEATRARADGSYLTLVIEEVLRRDTPLQNTSWRFVTEPMDLAGQRMEAGDPILLSLLAANRDPEVHPEPLAFRPGERPVRHVAFGVGPHICIGAALARMQASAALETLFGRAPSMTLTVPEDRLVWWPSAITRGLHHLPVEL